MGNTGKPILALAAAALAAALLGGCPLQPRSDDNGSTSRPNDDDTQPPPPTYQLIVSLQVLTVLAPSGKLDEANDFWPLLSESPVGLKQREALDANGLRAAVGRPELLEQIKKVLIAHKSKMLDEASVSMVSGAPAAITLAAYPKGQTLFLRTAEGGLSGLSFEPPVTNLLRVACRIEPPQLDEVVFDVVPEIRFGQRRRTFQMTPSGIQATPPYQTRLLLPTRFVVAVPKGHFLVIGPSPRADVKLTVGAQMLHREEDREAYDMLLILSPSVVRRELPPEG